MQTPAQVIAGYVGGFEGLLSLQPNDNGNYYDPARYTAKTRLNRPDGILMPGLINTHTHAAMSLFRGISDDLALQEWLTRFIFPSSTTGSPHAALRHPNSVSDR